MMSLPTIPTLDARRASLVRVQSGPQSIARPTVFAGEERDMPRTSEETFTMAALDGRTSADPSSPLTWLHVAAGAAPTPPTRRRPLARVTHNP